jgi:hypothetical protein
LKEKNLHPIYQSLENLQRQNDVILKKVAQIKEKRSEIHISRREQTL